MPEPAPEIVYVVKGSGVRLARRVYLQGHATRTRSGRRQACIAISQNNIILAGGETREQWVDAALVFTDRAEAEDVYRRARELHGPRKSIMDAAIELRKAANA